MFGLDALEFDGNLFPGDDVGAYAGSMSSRRAVTRTKKLTEVDVTEAATSDFASDTVLVPNSQILSYSVSLEFCRIYARYTGKGLRARLLCSTDEDSRQPEHGTSWCNATS